MIIDSYNQSLGKTGETALIRKIKKKDVNLL